jgi:hypothetical protein
LIHGIAAMEGYQTSVHPEGGRVIDEGLESVLYAYLEARLGFVGTLYRIDY